VFFISFSPLSLFYPAEHILPQVFCHFYFLAFCYFAYQIPYSLIKTPQLT